MSETKTVLIVDDDRDVAAGVELRLRLSGYAVLVAHGGTEAIRMAAEHRPDVIVLDLRMPSPDGVKVFHRLRDRDETRDIPVVVFTVDSVLARRTQLLGARYYVNKPYRPESLSAALEAAINDSSPKGRFTSPAGTFGRIDKPHGSLRQAGRTPGGVRRRKAVTLFKRRDDERRPPGIDR